MTFFTIGLVIILLQNSSETDELVVQKALDLWSSDGNQLLPGDDKRQRHVSGLANSNINAGNVISNANVNTGVAIEATEIKINLQDDRSNLNTENS